MERVFITGVSGYIGGKLVSRLNETAGTKEIIGIDIVRPSRITDKLSFYQRDVRAPVDRILKEHVVDTLVHLAYVVAPIHNRRKMEDININGTVNVLTSCARAGVKQILYASSATAYGFHPDNDMPLTEESPLRGNDDFTYSRTKKETDGIFSEFIAANPDIVGTAIRPAFVIGPGWKDSLSRHLRKKLVMLPSNTRPFQFVHEDDLTDIVCLLLEKKAAGAFNVGAEGTITSSEMIRLLGNTPLPLPFGVMYALTELAWNLRLSFLAEFPGPALNLARYTWVVSSEKLQRELGYKYRYTTREAFEDFVMNIKKR
ncbi:MAG: SDR family oxidoreductase [Dehalococcoidia bacterium]|nr:MAG: SDR family oxidoreductase [Dehalococcoidia bacterium]